MFDSSSSQHCYITLLPPNCIILYFISLPPTLTLIITAQCFNLILILTPPLKPSLHPQTAVRSCRTCLHDVSLKQKFVHTRPLHGRSRGWRSKCQTPPRFDVCLITWMYLSQYRLEIKSNLATIVQSVIALMCTLWATRGLTVRRFILFKKWHLWGSTVK